MTFMPDAGAPIQPVVAVNAPKMGRWKASKTIVRESFALLKKDKEILWYPVITALLTLVAYATVGTFYFLMILGGDIAGLDRLEAEGWDWVATAFLFVMYLVTFLIANFFQACIMIIVSARFSGRDLTFGDGVSGASSKFGSIFVWSVIAATVGVILDQIASRYKVIGAIVATLLGAAWNIMTFFSLPALVLNNAGITGSFKESAASIRKVWGETIIVTFGVGLYFGIVIIAGTVILLALGGFAMAGVSAWLGIFFFALIPLYIIGVMIISSALNSIFKTVLYEYARTGQVPAGFSPEIVQNAITRKG